MGMVLVVMGLRYFTLGFFDLEATAFPTKAEL